ncbi:major facilitator superfamily transporter [Daldinia vernicosa]|uniref:major facilitator superfamily transporter n=1 Tax=Daldinia vernicosa TaxID=114800 RepID=UPI002007AB4C|nr:major facilitator superfamily transporter [Daldinia vernicosa]KAI0849385.1 major facilitator superfamily transporter [Daldinia vernicosa]
METLKVPENGIMACPPASLGRVPEDDPPEYSVFSSRQRAIIIAIASIIGLLSPLSSNLYTPAIPSIADDLGVSKGSINLTVTSYLVLQGISPMLWSTIGDRVGRRPLYLITLLVYLGACIGLSFCRSFGLMIGLRAIQAIGSSPTTSIGAGVIGDLVDSRRRGRYMGFYSALGGFATAFGPVLGGVFAQYTGWHGIFWFLLALTSMLLLITVLVMPETKRSIVGNGQIECSPYWRPLFPYLDAPKQIKRVEKINHSTVGFLPIGFRLLASPEVFCCVVFTGVCYAVWQMTMVAAATLYSERYFLQERDIGLTYISNGVGSLCGSLITGKALDWQYSKQMKHQNNESDTVQDKIDNIERARIFPLIPPTILYIISVLGFGWAVDVRGHVSVPIILGFFVGGFDTCILAGFSTLVVDLFESQSFSVTATMNLSRCLLAAGGTSLIQPLIERLGVGFAFTVCAAGCVAVCPLAAAELFRGKHWRHKRAKDQ